MSSIARVARLSMQNRSIRVLVTPTPISFAERRAILQVLEQYGPIEVFKMTPCYYSNYISVAKEQTTADKLVASSPLKYSIDIPRTATDIYLADLHPQSFTDVKPSVAEERTTGFSPEAAHDVTKREFKLDIFPAPYNHKFAMPGQPLHHSWPAQYARNSTFMATTLKQSLPRTIAAKGLAHWLFPVGGKLQGRPRGKAKRLQLKQWMPTTMKNKQVQE